MGIEGHPVAVGRGVVVEKIGSDFLVKTPDSTDVMFLSGEAAAVMTRIEAGQDVSWSDGVAELIRHGVLTQSPVLSRRGLIRAGAVGAGVGIVVLAMPSAATAASGGEGEVVALTFLQKRTSIAADGVRPGRHLITVEVNLPPGFVAPLPDPSPVSAKIGTDDVTAEFVSLGGASRDVWYITGKGANRLKWNISTAFSNGAGWVGPIDGEVVFTWGETRYRATGTIPTALGLPGPS